MKVVEPYTNRSIDIAECKLAETFQGYRPARQRGRSPWFGIWLATGETVKAEAVPGLSEHAQACEQAERIAYATSDNALLPGPSAVVRAVAPLVESLAVAYLAEQGVTPVRESTPLDTVSPLQEGKDELPTWCGHLTEGVDDKSALKAIFVLGAGGSGKSTISRIMFGGEGLKEINPDRHLERLLGRAKIPLNKAGDHYEMFNQARRLKDIEQSQYAKRRLGMIIDITGWDYRKVASPVEELRDLGYDCYCVLVDTSLDTSLKRNQARALSGGRLVPDSFIKDAWYGVQDNKGKYKTLFGAKRFFLIDNDSEKSPEDWQKVVIPRLRKIARQILAAPVSNPKGKDWVKAGGPDDETLGKPKLAPLLPPPKYPKYVPKVKAPQKPINYEFQSKKRIDEPRPLPPIVGGSPRVNADPWAPRKFRLSESGLFESPVQGHCPLVEMTRETTPTGFEYYVNPTARQLHDLLRTRWQRGGARGYLVGTDAYWWKAYEMTHEELAAHIGETGVKMWLDDTESSDGELEFAVPKRNAAAVGYRQSIIDVWPVKPVPRAIDVKVYEDTDDYLPEGITIPESAGVVPDFVLGRVNALGVAYPAYFATEEYAALYPMLKAMLAGDLMERVSTLELKHNQPELRVYVNATPRELSALARRHHRPGEETEAVLRGLPVGNDIYWWVGGDAIHADVAEVFGLEHSEWYPHRLAVIPKGVLDDPQTETEEFQIYSPDYGKGLNHPRLRSLKLKYGEDADYAVAYLPESVDTVSAVSEGDADAPADRAAAKRLANYVRNSLKAQYIATVVRPIALYKAKKVYNREKAPKLAMHIVVDAGRKIGSGANWHETYGPKTRELAEILVRNYAEKDAAAGLADATLPAKYQPGFRGYGKPVKS